MKTEATGADKHWVQEMFNNKTVSYELHNRNFVLYLRGFFRTGNDPYVSRVWRKYCDRVQ